MFLKISKFFFIYILIILIFIIIFKDSSKADYNKLFYDISIKSIDGDYINLSEYKEKIILIVNVASNCGFTKQYEDLQNLWEKFRDKGLIVLVIPSKSFNQEKNNEKEVKEFCEINFNINFPMTSIFEVKGTNAHEIYKWAYKNYGSSTTPKWNFHKILINKDGKIEDSFLSFTNPMSKKIVSKIENLLD